jgi:acetoacetyl-CoA synthetase
VNERFVRVNEGGTQVPIVFFSTWVGAEDELARLGAAMGPDQPIIGVAPPSLDGPMPQDMADWVRFHRDGFDALGLPEPYRLAGFSFGGVIALDIAVALRAEGRDVAFLAMIDAMRPNANPKGVRRYLGYHLRELVDQPDPDLRRDHVRRLVRGGGHRALWRVRHHLLRAPRRLGLVPPPPRKVLVEAGPTRPLNKAIYRGWLSHRPPHYDGAVVLMTGDENRARAKGDPSLRWAPYLRGGFEVVPVPGEHMQILDHPNVEVVAAELAAGLARAEDRRSR